MISISVSMEATGTESLGPIKISTLQEAAARSTKYLEDLEFLITGAEYGDAASFVGTNDKFNPKLAKMVIELNGLAEIGPKDIVDRKEQDVLDLIAQEKRA